MYRNSRIFENKARASHKMFSNEASMSEPTEINAEREI